MFCPVYCLWWTLSDIVVALLNGGRGKGDTGVIGRLCSVIVALLGHLLYYFVCLLVIHFNSHHLSL